MIQAREAVTVNNPMTYKSVVFYQTSFGPAVNLVITDSAGQDWIVYHAVDTRRPRAKPADEPNTRRVMLLATLVNALVNLVPLLAVTTAKRVGVIPDVPTIAESGVPGTQGFESTTWFALFAPKGTDPAIVAKFNGAVRQVLQMPEVRAKLEAAGNAIRLEDPQQFRATVKANRAKWAEVVRQANISID